MFWGRVWYDKDRAIHIFIKKVIWETNFKACLRKPRQLRAVKLRR